MIDEAYRIGQHAVAVEEDGSLLVTVRGGPNQPTDLPLLPLPLQSEMEQEAVSHVPPPPVPAEPKSIVTWGDQGDTGSLSYEVQGFQHTTGKCRVLERDFLVIPNAIPFIMEQLGQAASELGCWTKPTVARESGVEQDYAFRDCLAMGVNQSTSPKLAPFARVLEELEPLWIMAYQALVNRHMAVNRGGGWELLRYSTGHFFREHVDAIHDHSPLGARRLTMICFSASEDILGGEFIVPRHGIKITPRGAISTQNEDGSWTLVVEASPGTLIGFPGTCSFPHEATKVLSGQKSSLVSFFS